MLERGLDVTDVAAALGARTVVEEYDDDALLVLGRARDHRPFHLVIRDAGDTVFVITLYEPDPHRWDATFTRRIAP